MSSTGGTVARETLLAMGKRRAKKASNNPAPSPTAAQLHAASNAARRAGRDGEAKELMEAAYSAERREWLAAVVGLAPLVVGVVRAAAGR